MKSRSNHSRHAMLASPRPTMNYSDTVELKSRTGRQLHVGGPNLGNRQLFDRLVDEIFDRRWFTNDGQVVKELETRLCQYLGVKHCIPVCNATTGLQLACRALELTGEIIVPSFTFVATPHAVRWQGLTPVFADVNLTSHTVCCKSVASLINDRTSAIIGVHLWGHPCDVDLLQAIANEFDIKLLYDAAHAFGCRHHSTMVGNFGNCEVFSFHATKFFNTFEGGAIATNDDELASKLRLMRNFGFEGMDHVTHLGTNAKMPEICAAMGLSMFDSIDQFASHNRSNFRLYETLLQHIPGIQLFSLDHLERANRQYVVIEVDEHEYGISRDETLRRLHHNNIRARRYFYPGCHRMPAYAAEFAASGRQLKNTDELCRRVLCLPTGTSITAADIFEICDVIRAPDHR
jgi:dTDP-4-amino-4,6-dideoxygalactose transaminase